MTNVPHGARHVPAKQHPVLDIRHWKDQFPLGNKKIGGGSIDNAVSLAYTEQARSLALAHGDLGPSVPADFFVWSKTPVRDKPWLTRMGGTPWREKDKPWPNDPDGIPLHFLGQICFADSKDILPCELPGDVALIFGRWQRGYTFTDAGGVLEWSPLKLREPERSNPGWTTTLPFQYQGIIHRSLQYTDWKIAEGPFKKAGWDDGGWRVHSTQVTSIAAHADLPQGWPFKEGDGNTLIATFNSMYFRGEWPLCDVSRSLREIDHEGRENDFGTIDGLSMRIGDVGCAWIYRDKDGVFRLDEAF